MHAPKKMKAFSLFLPWSLNSMEPTCFSKVEANKVDKIRQVTVECDVMILRSQTLAAVSQGVGCCVCLYYLFYCKEQNVRAFNKDECCHLAC